MTTTPDLLYTDTEDALRDSIRSLLRTHCDPHEVLGLYDGLAGPGDTLWTRLRHDLGVAGLLVPERFGGYGDGGREAAVVLEELGRASAPVPFLTSAVVATTCLAAVDDGDALRALAAGETTAAVALPLAAAVPARGALPRVSEGGRLSGTVTSVADAGSADVLVVPARGPEGLELHAVPASSPGLSVVPVLALDMTRPLYDLDLDEVETRALARGHEAESAVESALAAGAALLASEQVGVAEWCLETTVAYLKERTQFGRAVGSFQAVKHRLADLWLEVTTARATARYAADCAATRSADAAVAGSLAQAFCAETAVHAAEECLQLHGGIAMTWEHPAHLYLKRAKADELAFGTPGWHRARLADLVDLQP